MTLPNQTIRRGILTLTCERSAIAGHHVITLGQSSYMLRGEYLNADWYTTPPIPSVRAWEIFRKLAQWFDRTEWLDTKACEYLRTSFSTPELAGAAIRGYQPRAKKESQP